MCRFIQFLLLCVLPLQFALGGTVDAFEHARSGHAEHSHAVLADVKEATGDAQNDNDEAPRCNGECGICHFFHSFALFASRIEALTVASTAAAPSLHSAEHRNRVTALRPERPKWSQLA
jgi:hypothetical protein